MDSTWPQSKRTTKGHLEKISGEKCERQDTSTAGGRWRQQHRTELQDGKEWSVTHVPLEARRLKTRK